MNSEFSPPSPDIEHCVRVRVVTCCIYHGIVCCRKTVPDQLASSELVLDYLRGVCCDLAIKTQCSVLGALGIKM